MPNERVIIRTTDGDCSSNVLTPSSGGPWPAVIFYMDAGGIRPTVVNMAQRLADSGYVVLLPDIFYRFGAYGPLVQQEVFAAGTWPDRLAAVASFHGGNLATDAPTSPHLLAPKLKAELYIAAAENDGSYPPEMAERLEQALTRGGVRYKTETYPAAHGWMKPDFPVYDHVAAECGWVEMLALFDRTLHHGD